MRVISASAALLCLGASPAVPFPAPQAATGEESRPETFRVVVTVRDENGVVVPSARVSLSHAGEAGPSPVQTDYVGRATFPEVPRGSWKLKVEKEGFYLLTIPEVRVGETQNIDATINHLQEYKETATVQAPPEVIDPTATAMKSTLESQEVLELPYTTTRDVRSALSLLPGVAPDLGGQIHVNGSPSNQVQYTLDGFDVTQPVSGLNQMRFSTDAVRGVDVEGSRTSAQYGRGSGGVLDVQTGMGDDHLRFYATDFVPSFQTAGGFHVNNVTPRVTLSGPIKKGRAWFYEAIEGEYDENLFTELPAGANMDYYWRASNLVRGQVNLSEGNRLIGSFVANRSRDDYQGLSIIQPLSTTATELDSAYLITLKDQATWKNGTLFEMGFGYNQFRADEWPLGDKPYVVTPGSARGNYYLTSNALARRYEGIANLYLPPKHWHGSHQVLVGGDLQAIRDDQLQDRRPFTIVREDGTLARSVSFSGPPEFQKGNFELASYVQDRWSPTDRVLIEAGLRVSGDEILRRALVSPRLATTFLLQEKNQTKLSAGISVTYDRIDLSLLSRPLAGTRQDIFYATDGITPLGPVVITQFVANPEALGTPKMLNWSLGIERKLPKAIYLKTEFIEKRGMAEYDYENQPAPVVSSVPNGLYILNDARRDHYDAVDISMKHTFKEVYPIFVSYRRSRALSNAVLDSTIDNPLFTPQLAGPLPWDSPNRVLSWGWVPVKVLLLHKCNLAYTVDWRTGYPYSLINADQELVGLPNRSRLPDYASLNLHLEKEFHLFGFQWAIRGGFNNITGRENPAVVNNNVDSPNFGQFGDTQHRAFTGRIRFLGRK